MSRGTARSLAALSILIATALTPAVRADVDPTDVPTMPTVETGDGCRFTVPAKLRPEVVYRVQTTFASDREQGITIYIWAQDNDKAGHWEERASYNSYFNGRTVTSEIGLAPGRIYLLAAYHKKARAPGYGEPWLQSRIESRPTPTNGDDVAPSLAASFTGGQGVTASATLTPIELPTDHSTEAAGR